MSGTKSGQSRSGDDVDADGYHVEERAQSEEYHQTKDVRDDGDRTEIHIREGKVVKLEEVKTRETIRLASDDEVRALTFADFEGLDEIEAGTEVTLEEYIKKEVRHEKTVDGEPVIEISMSEERKSEEVKEDPQWKKDLSLFPDSENGIDASTSIEFDQGPITETVVVSSQASSFASPAVDVALTPGSLALSASGAADANVSIIRDPTDVKLETSAHGKPKRLNGLFGKKKPGKDQNKGKQNVAAAGAVDMEMETDGVDKENEVHDYSSSRRHEIKHKRHIIEEVVIEDSDKFYEKQEKRPKMFHKGTLERKKESPLETSHEAAFIETGSVELKPPNVSLHAESLPNISAAESVTYVVDYDQQASGSVYLEGHDDKSLSEKYKWYSFPRKRVTGKTPVSASKSLQKQSKTKSQEEVVIFDGPDVDKTDRKWGLKFGKWTGQTASIPETVSTEQVTFVVDNEPVGGVASTEHDLPVTSAETHTFVVQSEQAKPSISGFAHPGKITVKEKHVVKADVEPETVTFVVEQDLPEMEVDLNKDEKHSLGLLGKIGGRAHEKDTSKTSLHSETVTYVVQTDFQKAELDNDKERSWGLSGKLGAPHSDKHTKKVHGEPETLTFVVEQDMPKAKVELNKSKEHSLSKIGGQLPEKHVSEPSIQSETVQFVVEQELQTAEVELQKDKERSRGLLGNIESQYPETSNKPTAESETVTFVIEQDLPKADVKIDKEKEHSWSLPKLGKIGSQHPETHTNKPIAESETVTFVIEQDLPKADVKIDKEKEHSWSLPKLGKIGSQHPETHTNEPTAESETVTFVIEQDLPKADVKMDKEKEHSWSLPKLPIKSGKESRKPDESQVQGNIGARHKQQEVVVDEPHYYTEKNPAGKKGEAELQVQGNLPAEESLTITVQGEGDSGKVSLSGDDEKGKKSWSLKWPTSDKKEPAKKKEKKEKKHRVQDEVIVDDAHLHMDEGKIKVRQGFGKQVKDSARVEIDANIEQPQGTAVKFTSPKKPDKQHLEGDETVTFIVEEKLPEVKLEYDGDKSGSWRPHGNVSSEAHAISENPESEVVTFVVEQDLPKGKVELEKEKKHSWSLSERVGGHLPERDTNKPSAESETVTFVIEQDLPKADVKLDKEKEHSRSFLGMFGGQKPEKDRSKPDIGSESVTFVVEQDAPKIETERGQEMMHLTVDPIGKNEGSLSAKHKSKSISQPQSETVIFVIEQDLPKADVKLDKEKEHSRSFLGMFGGHKPEKDKSKPDIGSESVTFVVEQDVPKIETEAKVELGKDKEHSSSLLGRLGGLFPEKASSKTSLEPESVTFVVEGQPISGGEGSISVSKPELKGEGKKRKQEERIADDTHLFSDESDIKLKPMKLTDIVRKKELQTPTQAESFTFVVTGEPEVTADLPTVSVTANGEEGMVIGPTQETVTFVVNEERPTAGEITDEKAKAEKSWTLPKFGWQNTDKKRDGDDTKHAEETLTFVVQNTGPADAAKNDNSHPEGHVLFDKKVELRPTSGTISTSKKPKDSTQEEVVVDDTHLYSYKSELSWSPFGGKSKTGAKPSAGVEQPKVQSTADDTPQTTQETVTYTITREVAAPDQDSSSASDKGKGGKPHKWKFFGKKSPKGSEQSGSNISLPSSVGSKDASLPRRKKQEEVIVGSDQDFVPDSHGIITTGKKKPGAKKVKDGGPIDTTVYTFKVEPGVAIEPADITSTQVLHDVTVAVPDQRAEIQTPQLEVVVATPEEHAGIENPDQWVTVSSGAETATTRPVSQLKFDLGDVKFVDNVKEEYLESPEVKTIVDPLKRSIKSDDRSRAEFHVNGIKDIRSTEHVEGSEVVSKNTAINFGTSTPKKDISTGAHGDEVRVTGSDHPFDVTVSSDTSINFVPQVGGGVYGGLDGSFEGSSVTGSRPSSFYSVPANVGGSSGAPPPQHFVVIAIDFGTTFSGYAFSFSRDISSIHVMRKWQDGDPGVVNMKTPTVLLLTPEGKFHSFGFTAKDFYHNLNPKEATKWLYFEKFKMALHYNADLSTGTELEASNGHSFPALSVFSHSLRFFRDHALREVSDQSETRILNEDVRWVITVPAIWKAPAKQFMRQAAYQAGIASADNPDQLLVALEPEAASVFIRKQRLQQLIPESEMIPERSVSPVSTLEPVLVDRVSQIYGKPDTNRWSQTLPADALSLSFQRAPSPNYTHVRIGEDFDLIGMRYMVADCGGGTVDITVYELSAETGKLAELYKATGGPYGSMGVDLEFEALLVDIFGAEFVDVFKAKRPAGWVDLMMAFESRKRAATPYKSKPLNVPLPFSFMDYHKKHKSSTVESAIRKYGNKDVRWSSQGMMRLMPEAMDRLFQPTLTKIKAAIGEVLNNPDVKGIKYIFLVGGFAESPMLQQEVRNDFSHMIKVLIPADASLAILKGAVCFGCDPGVVTVRKSRMSYGLSVLNKFIRGRHPESKLAYKDGVEWCVDVFDPLVLANQSVALGSSVVRSYTPAGPGQKFGNFEMYCSERDDVQFITDEGVEKEVRGQLRLDLSQLDQSATGGRRREVQARLTFGDTEIKVVALDVVTGNSVRATIDFLNK